MQCYIFGFIASHMCTFGGCKHEGVDEDGTFVLHDCSKITLLNCTLIMYVW